jgi:phenylpropionate dioxygenase-like ring-hydroxylating dioxygenase large terminal subunit
VRRGFDDLDRDAVSLPQFSIGVLAGLVFVNLDADAEPLAGWFGELEDVHRHLSRPARHVALQPLGLRRTRTISWVFTPEGGSLRAEAARKANRQINEKVMDEDVVLCDGVQEGLESLTYERGVLNRNEAAVLHFHDMLRETVTGIEEP